MNKKFYLLFSLTLLIGITQSFADYNITCERDCDDILSIDCNNTIINVLGFNSSNPIPTQFSLLPDVVYNMYGYENRTANISLRTPFFNTPDLRGVDGQFSNCYVYITRTREGGQITGNITANHTITLLNGSSASFTTPTCTNETITVSSINNICNNDSSIIDVHVKTYASTDGTCSGTIQQWYPYDIPTYPYARTCDGYEFSSGYDKEYYYYKFDTINNYYNYYLESDTYLLGTQETTQFVFEVLCDGTNYAWYYDRQVLEAENITLIDSNATYDYRFYRANVTWDECIDYDIECVSWGSPYNLTYLYSCNCPPEENNLGLFCEDNSCYLLCTGNIEDNPIYNETLILEGTLEGALNNAIETGTSEEITQYFSQKTTTSLSSITFFIDEYFFEFLTIGLFILLFIIAILFLTGGL